jgi:hypothetical protein
MIGTINKVDYKGNPDYELKGSRWHHKKTGEHVGHEVMGGTNKLHGKEIKSKKPGQHPLSRMRGMEHVKGDGTGIDYFKHPEHGTFKTFNYGEAGFHVQHLGGFAPEKKKIRQVRQHEGQKKVPIGTDPSSGRTLFSWVDKQDLGKMNIRSFKRQMMKQNIQIGAQY